MSNRQFIIFVICAVFAFGTLIGATVVWMRGGPTSSEQEVRSYGEALVGGEFELTDHTGARVTHEDFMGRYAIFYFGYTFCPDICPTSLQVLAVALDEMGSAGEDIQPVFVTVDPERDTVERMAEYVDYFGDNFIGLTGSPEEVAEVASLYRVYYAKVEDGSDGDDYLMDHSSIFYLMGPDGKFVKHFPYTTDAEKLAEEIAAHIE